MLFFITGAVLGWGFWGILPKSINNSLKHLICPSIGLFLFTELNIFSSFIFGVGIVSILISFFFEVLISILAFRFFKPSFGLEKIPILFILPALVIVLATSYIFYSQVLFPTPAGLKAGGGGVWGDTALHIAYSSRLETGEFPPQNPLFAGKTLVYPYANDLLSTVLRIGGLGVNLAFILPQVIFLISALALFYSFARKFTDDTGFLISLVLIIFGWGIGSIYFLKGPLIWPPSLEYTNNPDFKLYMHNLFTGLILPERSFLPGLFLGFLIFVNFYHFLESGERKTLILNGFLAGALPFWHTHTFIFIVISFVIFGLYLIYQDIRINIKPLLLSAGAAFLIAAPFLALFLKNQEAESFIRLIGGWQIQGENFFIFWFRNSFLIIPLALAGFWKFKKTLGIYFAGAFLTFLIANIIAFQPWEWDNIKLFSWAFIFFAVLSGIWLSSLFQKNYFYKIAVIILAVTSSFSGILSITKQISSKYTLYDKSDIELADWAKENTGIDEVFLVEPIPNHPVPGLAGRLVYLGYPGHLWVHGVDWSKRESLNAQVIGGDLEQVKMAEVTISYVVLPKGSVFKPEDLASVFSNDKYIVIKARS